MTQSLSRKKKCTASVSWTDQSLINDFSSKTVEMAFLEERLKGLEKKLAGNMDALEELELVLDEEALIPCKFGDIFVHSSVDAVKEQLQVQNDEFNTEIEALRSQIDVLKASISSMKSKLYSKFGDSIQLEYD